MTTAWSAALEMIRRFLAEAAMTLVGEDGNDDTLEGRDGGGRRHDSLVGR